MPAVIKTVNLTKRFGRLVALSNLTLEIQPGDCFGFIGPNGAGKTTTIKILATLLQPTRGGARICDFVVGYQSRQIRPLIGYVPDYFGAYEDMVVQEYREFFAAASNLNAAARTNIINDVLELPYLANKRGPRVASRSRPPACSARSRTSRTSPPTTGTWRCRSSRGSKTTRSSRRGCDRRGSG